MNNIVILAQQFSTEVPTVSPVFMIAWLAFLVLMIAAMWIVFSKAGKPGWYAIIPILNIVAMIDIAGKPWWWIIGFFIPFVNIIVGVLIYHGISTNFGKGALFTLGLLFLTPIFFLILAFGDAEYVGEQKMKYA